MDTQVRTRTDHFDELTAIDTLAQNTIGASSAMVGFDALGIIAETPECAVALPAKPAQPSEQIFADMVLSQQGKLFRFVRNHIGNDSDAEDIAQQAFLEAYRSLANFRGEAQLATWLYGIAMNLVRNFLNRSPRRLYSHVSDVELLELPSSCATPSDHFNSRQIVNDIEEGLQTLSPELRDVLHVVALNGFTYQEAADLLAVPVGTVRSRLSRARAQLKVHYETNGIDLPESRRAQ